MRVHTLTLTAIGPFPGTHRVDFTALTASGLFLLEGPTGAGKSTIIDALVFALYGETASTGASRERIASRHAAPGTAPVVELVFETGAGIYRVRRAPEHLRPKQRGTGLTREQAQVRLWRLADAEDELGEALSSRAGEADAEILRIVGLSREQFVQTVVLPQGEFAAFLRSTPEERRAVLQRLFGTEIYQRMQDQLVEAARGARRAAEAARAETRAAVDAFVRTATGGLAAAVPAGAHGLVAGASPAPGVGLDDREDVQPLEEPALARLVAAADAPAAETVTPLVDAVLAALAAELRHAAEGEAGALAVAERATAALGTARDLADRLARRAGLLAEQGALEDGLEELVAAERRLAAGRRADTALPTVRAALTAEDEARRATAALAASRARLEGTPDEDLADVAGGDLADLLATTQREIGALEPLLALERALPERQRAAARARHAVEAVAQELDSTVADLAARPARRRELEQRVRDLLSHAADTDAAALRVEREESVLAAAREAERLRSVQADEAASRASLAAAAESALEALTDLRRRRIAGLAGELAAALRPGTACPVCGDTEHPAPARRADDHPDAAAVEAAEAAHTAAVGALSEAAERAHHLGALRESALRAAGGREPAEVSRTLAELRHELESAQRARRELAAQEKLLEGFDAESDALRLRADSLRAAHAQAVAESDALDRTLAADRSAVGAAAGGCGSVAERAGTLSARLETAAALRSAHTAASSAEERLEAATAGCAAALDAAGFADRAEALAAELNAGEQERLDARVTEFRAARARVAGALATPDLASLTGREVADVDGAAVAAEAARAAHLDSARAATLARARLEAARTDATRLQEALATDAAAARAAAPVRRMADLAVAGEGNDRHHTLATFVLLRRFEEVVDAANARLAVMSNGRYALVRTDEREGGVTARRTGLGLAVEDVAVGGRRAPRTLSGGETFYVSLCLALGLADVVRAEAGGLDLGTLFIDEGFGSLDPDTLETVLRELGKLRSGGRAVGIVSHVTELKRQIAERIEVRRRPDGTSTLSVVA